MVRKIKITVTVIITVLLILIAFLHKGSIETNLLKTFLPSSNDLNRVLEITNKSSSVIKVIFEADDEEELNLLNKDFINKVDSLYFEILTIDTSKLIDYYLNNPSNFLTYDSRVLIKNKKYDELYNNAIFKLYNPIGFQLSTLDKDPYLLVNDFIMSLGEYGDVKCLDDKYYKTISLKIKNEKGLSPDVINKEISKLIKIQNDLSNNNKKIYFTGVPIHSYYASKNAIFVINIVCILSFLLITFLTYRCFGNVKMLLLLFFSILFGFLLGYNAVRIWFNDFQIITMVFSTTLIGIGIDYSYHYFFKESSDSAFAKNLSFSFLTTVIPFILLYLTKILLLEQISVFTVFGLSGIYFTVMVFYPCFSFEYKIKHIKFDKKIYKVILIVLLLLSMAGLFKINFNDSLTSFYSPSTKLKKAENIYNKVSDINENNMKIYTVTGKNTEDIIIKEEKIIDELLKNNIKYIALAKFVVSKERQKENFNLVKELYRNNLGNFDNLLTKKQTDALKNSVFIPAVLDFEKLPYFKNFMLNQNTSLMFIQKDSKINIQNKDVKAISFQADVQNYIRQYKNKLTKILPFVFVTLFILLAILYNSKDSIKILTSPVCGMVISVGIVSLIFKEINLFSIITLYILLGFTIDYSIFRQNKGKNTEDAVLVSTITTSFSFLLLSFSGFKLLSSMSLILFFGVITSYLVGFFIFEKNKQNDSMLKFKNEKD